MSKLELDDQILNHPKFIRAVKLGGGDAVHLWLGIRAYCGQYLTDGFVPSDMIDEVRGPTSGKKRAAALQVLVEVRLLDPVEGGVRMHDFLQWSRSKSQVIADRERARERQAKSRGMSRRDSGVTHEDVTDAERAEASGSVTKASASPTSSASASSDPDTHNARTRPPDPLRDSLTGPDDELPEGWRPSPENIALAIRLGLVLEDELGEYTARCRRDKRVCGNWPADFELWLRRSKKFERERAGRRGSGGTSTRGGPSEEWPSDEDISLREAIRGGAHGPKLKARLDAGQLDAALARRLIRERETEIAERRTERGDPPPGNVSALLSGVGRAMP